MRKRRPPLTCNGVAGCLGGVGPAAREDACRDEGVSGAAVPGGEHSGVSSWRAELDCEGQPWSTSTPCGYTQWFNALAAPAAVVPVGRSPEGLPIGVQIVARPFEDETALGVAAIVDAAFGYRPPPMALALI